MSCGLSVRGRITVSALHVHLSKLRDLLGESLVLREAAGYSLRAGHFELDCQRFDALVDQARSDPGQARALLGQALALHRGEPLCDVACEGSVAQWHRAVDEKVLQALLLRIEADLAAGAAGELVAELESLLSAHPFEERLWGALMLALYRSGRQADALDAYSRAPGADSRRSSAWSPASSSCVCTRGCSNVTPRCCSGLGGGRCRRRGHCRR